MNKVYKVIWSKARNCYVVVSELAKRNGKCSSSLNKKIIAAFLAAGMTMAATVSVEAVPAVMSVGTATGTDSVAGGQGALATGAYSVAVGNYAIASTPNTTLANLANAQMMAYNALQATIKDQFTGYNAMYGAVRNATDYAALVTALYNVMNSASSTTAAKTAANNCITMLNNRVAILQSPSAAKYSIAVGNAATAVGSSAIAVGNAATAVGPSAIAVGRGEAISLSVNRPGTAGIGNKFTTSTPAGAYGNYDIALGKAAAYGNRKNSTTGDDSTTDIGGYYTTGGAGRAIAVGYETLAVRQDTIAVGTQALAGGQDAIAVGRNARALTKGSIVIGGGEAGQQGVQGNGGINTPKDTPDKGGNSIAIGSANNFTYGYDNTDDYYANTKNSIAIGYKAHTHAANAFAIGISTDATAERSFAIGTASTSHNNTATHQGARASGQGSIAFGDTAIVMGEQLPFVKDQKDEERATHTSVNDAIAIGTNTLTRARNAVTLGGGMSYTYHDVSGNTMINKTQYYNGSGWVDSKAEGSGAKVGFKADGAVAIGGATGTVVGSDSEYFPTVKLTGTISDYTAAATIGDNATRAVAIGSGSVIGDNAVNSVAVGARNIVSGVNSTAVGSGDDTSANKVSAYASGSFGNKNLIGKQQVYAEGNLLPDSTTTDVFVVGGNNEIANASGNATGIGVFGSTNKVEGSDSTNSTIIGNSNTVTNKLTNSLVAGNSNTGLEQVANSQIIGNSNTAIGANVSNLVVLGNSTKATGGITSAIAIGQRTTISANNAIAMGTAASVSVKNGVALGSSSVASRDAGLDTKGAARNGYDAYYAGGHINTSGESFNSNYIWRSTLAGVSVGDAANGLTRRIEGVAAGWEDTDAVNVAQLKAATIEVKAGNGISVTPSVREGGGIVYTIDAIGGAASSATISSDKRAVDVVNTEGQQIVTSPFLNIQGVPEAAETDRAIASGASAIAMGHGAQATETNATAIGTKAHALGESGVAIGTAVSTSGERAIAIGSSDAYTESHLGTRAAGQGAIVLGDRASAVSDEYDFTKGAVKAGHDTDTNVNDAIAIGTRTQSRAQNAIALGGNLSYTYETTGADNVTTTKTVYGELKGRSAGATVGDAADSGIAIGGAYGSIDKTNKTVTIEIDAAATYGKRGIAIGTGALVADKADFASLEELMSRTDYVNLKNNYNTKYADYMRRLNDYNAIQNSTNPLVTDEMKNDARISLNKAEAALETATTNFADVIKTKLQLQAEDSAKEEDAIAIGTRSNATVRTSVALGAYSATTALDKAGNRTGTVGYDVSTGKQYAGADKFSPTWQSTAGSLSIGGGVNPTTGETVTRRISNVAAGVYDTDAVNVAQLRRAAVYKTDFKNTAIGKDENGYLEITSPFINVQGVKEASEANTLLNTYQNAADYKKSVDADIQTMRDGKANLERDIRTLTKDIQTLEKTMASAGSQTSAAYISAKTEKQIKEDELAVLKGELKELNGSLQEKIEESATANERYAEAQKTVKSQAKAEGENAMALGYGTTASGDESIAMGKGNKATGKQSLAIGTGNDVTGNHSGAIGDPNIVNADNSYTVGNNSNIAAGQTDVFAFGNDITKTTSNSVFLGSKSAYVPEGKTTAGMSDYSSANIDGRTLRFAGGKPAGVVSVGNENEPRRIQNVAAGKISADSTDAINGSQLYGAMTEMNNNVNSQIGGVEHRMKKGLAGAAALAALHPLDFDPDDKLTFAAGMGHYRGENAAALGMFYRPDEKVMFSVGGTMGNGENMINAGVSFSLDRTARVTGSRTALTKEVVQLREHVAKQDAQIAELTALVKQLAGNAGLNLPAGSALPGAPALFPDNLDNKWAYDTLEELEQKGYITGYAGRSLSRQQFAAALDMAMAGGAKLDERIVKEFEPELSHVRVAQVEGKGNYEGEWYERPRASHDRYEDKQKIEKKHFRVQEKKVTSKS